MYPRFEWKVLYDDTERASSLLDRVLRARGLQDPLQVEQFLSRSAASLSLPDMGVASARLLTAGRAGETVYVHGDYDVDGITSTAIMRGILRHLGAHPVCHIPDRDGDGYGLLPNSVSDARSAGASLIVAVDCGTSDFEAVREARQQGMDVVILDHHMTHSTLPEANAVVNPQRQDAESGFRQLSAAGVCYMLACELMGDGARQFIDLAALGTIADVMPLVGMNRDIVAKGLLALGERRRPGLRALWELARIADTASARDVAFQIAPRLNAAGRMGRAIRAFDLLLCEEDQRASEIALLLEQENRARQALIQQMVGEALSMVPTAGFPVAVFAREGWKRGLLGLLAGKLCEAIGRPALAVSLENGMGRGSARSTLDFDIFQALSRSSDMLSRFGGHSRAAGFDVAERNLENLKQKMSEVSADFLPGAPMLLIDGRASLGELTVRAVESLEQLEPCGEANPRASFLITVPGAFDRKRVGATGQHIKFSASPGNGPGCIWFNAGDSVLPEGPLDLVVEPRINNYGSRTSIELVLRDLRVHRRDEIRVEAPGARAFVVRHGTSDSVMQHLQRYGNEVVTLDGQRAPGFSPEAVRHKSLDLLLPVPPREPFWLREVLSTLGPKSRVVLAFQREDIQRFVARCRALAPDRDTLRECYKRILKVPSGNETILAHNIAQDGLTEPEWSGDLARTALSIFQELGLVVLDNGAYSVVQGAPRNDLENSPTFCSRKAEYWPVVQLYNELGCSVLAFLDWLKRS